MSDVPITEQIRAIIVRKFPIAGKRKIADQDHLLERGILDSLGVLDLIGELEREFGIAVVDDDLVPENFASIERLVDFVGSKQRSGGARTAPVGHRADDASAATRG